MMYMLKPHILIISSATSGSGVLTADICSALREEGCEVDVLTRDDDSNGYLSALSKSDIRWSESLPGRLFRKIRKIFGLQADVKRQAPGYSLYYLDELRPPVRVKKVLAKINKQYDFAITLFLHQLSSFRTIKEIDDKLGHVPWAFFAVDFMTLGGGCHFPLSCKNWENGCGRCPALGSHDPDDRTHRNFIYRKEVLKNLNFTLCCNTFMRDNFYSKSPLYKDRPIEISYNLIDENAFCPRDIKETRRELNLSNDKFIIFFGSQNLYDPKKGMNYLFDALKIFNDYLNDEARNRVLVVSAGRVKEDISKYIAFDYDERGFVSINVLAKLYAASNVFVCPSVFDPGPMMINQALSCGTPVVAFDSGGMLDVKQYADVGYVAKLKDANDMAEGIRHVFSMCDEEYAELRNTCRATALKMTSRHAVASRLLSIYSKMKNS